VLIAAGESHSTASTERLRWEWFQQKHKTRGSQLTNHTVSSQFSRCDHKTSKSRTSKFTNFRNSSCMLFWHNICKTSLFI